MVSVPSPPGFYEHPLWYLFIPRTVALRLPWCPLVWEEGFGQLLPMMELEVLDVTPTQWGSILKEKSEEGGNV